MKRSRLAVALVAAAICSFAAVRAEAACTGRPTDASGYQGYMYAPAMALSYASPGGKALVHYATSGANAVDVTSARGDMVPDTVALAGDVADKAFAKYAEMGFKLPPGDGACGGDDKIDIYLVAFAGADGTTVPEACNGRACSSFLLVESTFNGRGYPTIAEGFRTVVAHELFHSVQNAYDSEIDRFWAEGTAQWAMKNVYPEVVDFERQLPAFFKDPTRSIDTQPSGVTSGFLYGSAVWPLFLTLRHGPDTVRMILEHEADGTKAIAAADAVLITKGSSIAEDYPLFGAWNAATNTLAGTGGYPDAAKYPGVKIASLDDGVNAIASGLAYFPYRTTLAVPMKIWLETDESRNAGVAVPIENGKPNLTKAQKLPANLEGDVLVVVGGITTKKTDAPFTLHIVPPDGPVGSSGGMTGDAGTTGGSSSGDGGGCAVASASDPSALPVLALAVAGMVLVRARRSSTARPLSRSSASAPVHRRGS
jgi:MYXO-CTERM domain-containing protein